MLIRIRKATSSDLESVALLFDQYRAFYHKTSDLEGAKNFLAARLKNKESILFVAENTEAKLLGFAQLYPLFSSTRMKPMWLLNDLYVDANSRNLGIGAKLIDACQQYCIKTGACALSLETGKTNNIGNHLYPRTGFVLDQENNYYEWEVPQNL